MPFIFERFRQADSSYTRKVGGLGLGLAIVRHLVELHGGNVSVKSEGENKGTSFTVSLPILHLAQTVIKAETVYSDNGAVNNSEIPNGLRVLLVEDNEDSREMMKVMLDQLEFETTAVGSASEALKEFNRFKPDILISDIGMPGEDGYALIRKVRQIPPAQGGLIPAIALTGYASLQDRDLALKAGYQAHFTKPIDIDKLVVLIKDLLKV